MLAITALALHSDLVHEGGVLHAFFQTGAGSTEAAAAAAAAASEMAALVESTAAVEIPVVPNLAHDLTLLGDFYIP